jgi:hypothetical protein
MTTDCKHPSAAFWATVVVVVGLVAYPVSFGPACGLTSRVYAYGEPVVTNRAMFVYLPFGKAILHAPNAGYNRFLIWWINVCLPTGHTAVLPTLVEGQDPLCIENP